MASAAVLLLAGAALCAAGELKEATTTRNEVKEIKISSKESKDFFDKLGFDLEPAMSHGFPLPLALPVPWSEDTPTENRKSSNGRTADERSNIIPLDVSTVSTDANAASKSKSEDLINTANRMMIEEARRRRLFRKKMETLLQKKLPKTSSKEVARVLEKPESIVEVEEIPERHGAPMMSDAFSTFRRIAHVMPLIHHLVSSRFPSPFASLPEPLFLKSENPSPKDTSTDDDDHAVLMMSGFSFDGSPPVIGSVPRRPSERLLKIVPDDSVRIDVAFVPMRPEARKTPQRALSPFKEIDDTPNIGPEIPFPTIPLFSRILNMMSRVRQSVIGDTVTHGHNSTDQRVENMTKIEPLENRPSSQQEPTVPPQPASNNSATLKLAKDLEENVKFLTTELDGEMGKRSKRDVHSSSEREDSTQSPPAPEARMMVEDEAEPQGTNSRMMAPEVADIGGQPSPVASLPMGMHMPFYPTVAPNMFLNSMKMPFWKQFYKVMPYYLGGAPLEFDKLAYQMKMFPKLSMPVGMAGAQHMGMVGVAQQYAMNNLAATQAAAESTAAAAAAAGEAKVAAGAAGAAPAARFHPLLNVPCVPTCAPLRGRRSARAKRSIRGGAGGGGAVVQQALDAPANHGKGEGEEKRTRNEVPTNGALSPKEPRKEPKGKVDSPTEQKSSSFQQSRSNQKTPQSSPSRTAPLQGTPISSESADDEKRESLPGFEFGNYPFQWRAQIPLEESGALVDEQFPGVDDIYQEAMLSGLKDYQGMKSVKSRKKVPSLWEATIKPDQSAELWTRPQPSPFAVVPFFSPLLGEGEGAGEELLLGERSFARPRRSLVTSGAGGGGERETFWDEVLPIHEVHAVRRGGHSGAVRHLKVHSHGGRLRAGVRADAARVAAIAATTTAATTTTAAAAAAADVEESGRRVKRVRTDRMPFLDPSMTEDSRFDSFFRRDLGNDFSI